MKTELKCHTFKIKKGKKHIEYVGKKREMMRRKLEKIQ
jgi:hypothetical protein